jgi:hypothetical protein
MKNSWPTRFGLLVILAGSICLAGCASLPPRYTNNPPATVVYMVGSVDTAIKGYSTASANSSSPISTLTYPPSYYGGPVATDASGQIYVAVGIDPVDPLNLGNIFIYPPNSAGKATPSRTIDVNSNSVCALAVDPAGLLYVAINTGSAVDAPPPMVIVYSATASGPAIPLRTLQLTNVNPDVKDIAVDGSGNIYVAGVYRSTGNAIAVYPPTANGFSTPTRTITFGTSTVYGVAVDPVGDVYANVCLGCYGTDFAIEEFAPGANGDSTPINTINIPIGSGRRGASGGSVRLDGAGNIFTTMDFISYETVEHSIVVYGFGPSATGSAVPTVQITPTDWYNTFFAVN